MQIYLKKTLKSVTSFRCRKLRKQDQIKPKADRRKRIGVNINEIENRKPIEKINESNQCFFLKISFLEKMNKIYKPF